MKSEAEVLEQFDRHKKDASKNGAQYDNTKLCQAIYAGDFEEARKMLGEKEGALKLQEFNKARAYTNAVCGFLTQNRRKCKFASRERAPQVRAKQTDYTNNLYVYVRENANADQIETRQDLDMLVCGYGAVETCLTYGEGYASRNPDGEILMQRLDPLAVAWDPSAREANLLDARWVWYKKEYHIDDALELFESSKEDDFEEDGGDPQNATLEPAPGGGGIKSGVQTSYDWASQGDKTVYVYFYQWYDIESYWRATNPVTMAGDQQSAMLIQATLEAIAQGQEDDAFKLRPQDPILDCNTKTKAALEEAFGDAIEFVEFKRKVYYRAAISGQKVFNVTRNDSQQGFSIKFKTGGYHEPKRFWMGMINPMIAPVIFYNKALTELIYSVSASAKGGLMYEEGAIPNEKDLEANYLHPTKNIKVAAGALSGGQIQPKKEPYTPSGAEVLAQIANDSLPEINGIDRSFLGASESMQETAALQRQRIKQALNTLACYFDSVGLYQKEHARLALDFMRVLAQNAPGLLFRLTDKMDGEDDLAELLPEPLDAQYDVIIEEAPDTASEKQERMEVFTTIGTQLLSMQDPAGKVFYATAIMQMGLDQKTQQRLLESLQPQQQQVDPMYVKQLEGMVQALKEESNQAMVAKTKAEAVLKASQVQETIAKTEKLQKEAIQTDIESRLALLTGAQGTQVFV